MKGGAIYHEGTNLGTVTDCYFTSNRADYGGAIYHLGNNFQIEGTWKVIFDGDPHYILPTFLYNTANYGGAIYNQGSATIIYYNLIENTAGQGNAIYQDYSGTFTANGNYWGFDADPKTVPNTIAGSISKVITSSHLSTYYGVALALSHKQLDLQIYYHQQQLSIIQIIKMGPMITKILGTIMTQLLNQ